MGREDAEKCGIKVERQRRQRPDRQEDDLAPQVVANLDFLLVLVSRLVNLVVVFRLKEEVPDLPAGHRHDPSDQSGHRRIPEHHRVRTEKADSAQQVKRLIDPAVVIEAVVVPTLHSKGLEKALHISSPCCAWMSMLWRFDESAVTDARMPGAGELLTAIGSDQAAACAPARSPVRQSFSRPSRSELTRSVQTAALPGARPAARRASAQPNARNVPKKTPFASQVCAPQ